MLGRRRREMMHDILARLRDSSPNEGSHDLHCRCLDAADEVERLRAAMLRCVIRLEQDGDEHGVAADLRADMTPHYMGLTARQRPNY